MMKKFLLVVCGSFVGVILALTFFVISAIIISHLYKYGEEPAFSGRFCEMFSNGDERHD